MTNSEVIDEETGEVAGERVLTRGDMLQPNALETFQERGRVGNQMVPVSHTTGTTAFTSMLQIMEFAKLMAMGGVAIPKFLRANPGACLAVTMQANEWGMSPFAVANKAYSVNDRIAYESQLVHAVIERRAPLKERLDARWEGDVEKGTRKCIVTGWLHGESKPREWASPEIGKIKTKNSPEWAANPDKQLFYHASRDWARIWVPDVLLGIYTRDEMLNIDLGNARDEVPSLAERAPAKAEGGFDEQGIATTLSAARGDVQDADVTEVRPEPEPASEPRKSGKRASANTAAEKAQAEQLAGEERNPQGAAQPEQVQAENVTGWQGGAPANRDEYAEYFAAWLDVAVDRAEAEARWENERALRAELRVTVVERKKMEKALNERFS